MSDHSPLARGLLVVVLTIGVLGFGAVGLCSGVAAVRAVPALFRQGGSVSLVILVGALSCALAGFFMTPSSFTL